MNQDYQQQQYQQNFPPKNWLVESILVTLFCCLPLGIVGIVFAAQVNSKFAAGDHAGAISASKDAGKFTKIGFWLGIAVQLIIGILWVFFLGGLAILSHRNLLFDGAFEKLNSKPFLLAAFALSCMTLLYFSCFRCMANTFPNAFL